MKKFISLTLIVLIFISANSASFADVKIKQKVTFDNQGMEQTRMIKGARERRETKIVISEEAGDLLPNVATITQCDLRRTLQVNDKKKLYTVDPFNDDATAADAPTAPKTVTKTRQGGTVTLGYSIADTGERKQMFGLTARHLKISQSVESSADSCGGAGKSKMEIDGWYADFSADFNCPIDLPDAPPPSKPDCRDRVIYKRSGAAKLGFLLDGTMKMFDDKGKVTSTIRTETLEISRAPLSVSFFDVGKDYKLATNAQEVYAMPSVTEMMGMADDDAPKSAPVKNSTNNKSAGKKYVGLDFFSGNSAKVNQDAIRQTMMENLNDKGFAASFVTSPNEITNGRFDYVVGVEIVNAKQSKAGKIGGLFGKVTGSTDAAKVGDSEAEVVVTIYQKDGRTVVGQQTSKQKIAGTPDDAAKSAIENALGQLIGKIK